MSDHGHFTPRPCQNCRDKKQRIEELEAEVDLQADHLHAATVQFDEQIAEIERLRKATKKALVVLAGTVSYLAVAEDALREALTEEDDETNPGS